MWTQEVYIFDIKITQNQFDPMIMIYHQFEMETFIDSKKKNIQNFYLD